MLLLAMFAPPLGLWGQSQGSPPPTPATPSSSSLPWWSNRGHWTWGGQLGFALENDIPRNISHIALLIAQPQIGFVVRDFESSPVRRFEMVGEGILGGSVHPGGRLLGGALFFRLHAKNRRSWVPFLDLGAGMQNTTLHLRVPELSGSLQFSPQVGLGVQYFVRPQRAIVLEYRYLHMSNAGIEPPNHGFNASMLTLGFRWLRRPRSLGAQAESHFPGNPLRRLFDSGAGVTRRPFF